MLSSADLAGLGRLEALGLNGNLLTAAPNMAHLPSLRSAAFSVAVPPHLLVMVQESEPGGEPAQPPRLLGQTQAGPNFAARSGPPGQSRPPKAGLPPLRPLQVTFHVRADWPVSGPVIPRCRHLEVLNGERLSELEKAKWQSQAYDEDDAPLHSLPVHPHLRKS